MIIAGRRYGKTEVVRLMNRLAELEGRNVDLEHYNRMLIRGMPGTIDYLRAKIEEIVEKRLRKQ